MTIGLGLLANAFLVAGSWRLAAIAFGQERMRDRILAASLLVVSWCLLGLVILGALDLLAVGPMCLWSLAPTAAGLACRGAARRRAEPPPAPVPEEPSRWEAVLSLGLVLWACAALGMQSLLLPVKVVSDAPIYHLYFAARWWKAGRLFLVPIPFGESAATYFPADGDLWFAWLMASWGGDRLAKVGQAPFLALSALAAYGMARRLGARRDASLIAACWFVAVVPLLLFSFEGNVDTIFVAGYLASAYFFLRYFAEGGGAPALIFAGLGAGLSLGTKSVGLVFVPPLLLLATVAQAARTRSSRRTAAFLATLLVPTLLNCGFWYGRNLWLTGNPVYPLHVELSGTTLLCGWYGPGAMTSSPYYLPIGDWRSFVDTMLAVLDPRLVPFWLLALAGAWAIGRREDAASPEGRWIAAFTLLAVLNVALYWLCLPYRTQQRFMLQAAGLAVSALARLLDRSRALAIAAALLLALHLLTPQTWPFATGKAEPPWDLSPVIPNAVGPVLPVAARVARVVGVSPDDARVLHLLLFLGSGCLAGLTAVVALRLGRRRSWGLVPRAVAVLAPAGLLLLAGLDAGVLEVDRRQRFYPPFPDFYRGWMQLEARSGPEGARVAYAGTNIPYYLQGIGLRNEVRYVNVDGHRGWLLHDYHREAAARGEPPWPNARPGWDRIHPDYPAWLGNLRAAGIQLLVVTKVNPGEGPHNVADAEGFPIERRWADAHPESFEPLYGARERDPWFRLYRLRPPRS